jgi:hypothetical protein
MRYTAVLAAIQRMASAPTQATFEGIAHDRGDVGVRHVEIFEA